MLSARTAAARRRRRDGAADKGMRADEVVISVQ